VQFLVDENLPRKLSNFIESLGHEVIDVASSSYRGSTDEMGVRDGVK
jgi:predicted nuclease of predicted toxin-antitoxin system